MEDKKKEIKKQRKIVLIEYISVIDKCTCINEHISL